MVKNIKNTKKANAGSMLLGAGAVLLVGGGFYYLMSEDTPTGDIIGQSSPSVNAQLVITDLSVVESEDYEIRTTYNPSTKVYDYEIRVSKTDIGNNQNQEFTLTMRNDLPVGTNIHDFSMIQDVKLGLNSDFRLIDTSGTNRVIISSDDSRINGERGSTKVTFIGTETQNVDVVYNLNPYSVDLSTLRDLESSSDRVRTTLDFGTKNKVELVITG